MLNALINPTFYNAFVVLPNADTPLHPFIADNPRLFPYFKDCLGATDCTHHAAFTPACDCDRYRDRDGNLTHVGLCTCDFSERILYCIDGWEGSAADATVFASARDIHFGDFPVPPGKYYLADGGFGASRALLLPYATVRYHLKEFMLGTLG